MMALCSAWVPGCARGQAQDSADRQPHSASSRHKWRPVGVTGRFGSLDEARQGKHRRWTSTKKSNKSDYRHQPAPQASSRPPQAPERTDALPPRKRTIASTARKPKVAPQPGPRSRTPNPALDDSLLQSLLHDPVGGAALEPHDKRKSSPEPDAKTDRPKEIPALLSRSQIKSVLQPLSLLVQQCAGDVTGVAKVAIVVQGQSGKTLSAAAIGALAGTPAALCVEELMRTSAVFPRFKKHELKISYPYKL
ncbi:MAG: hypothetical protein MJD61_20765 [Proteobacteria bacterium]|nr:hypothetical protein [Pseudomonadota bacterium]